MYRVATRLWPHVPDTSDKLAKRTKKEGEGGKTPKGGICLGKACASPFLLVLRAVETQTQPNEPAIMMRFA